MTPVMKITEALVVLFLVLFCYLFLDKISSSGASWARFASGRWRRQQADCLDPPRRRRRRTAAGAGRHPGLAPVGGRQTRRVTPPRRKGNGQERPLPASDGDRNTALCKRPFRDGYIRNLRRSPRRRRNTLMREAATEEVMDIGCETTAPACRGRRVSLRSS